MPNLDTFEPDPSQLLRMGAGMSIDFWYVREHPVTGDLHIARIELLWDEQSGGWKFLDGQNHFPFIAEGSNVFVSEDEAREAMKRNEWKREIDETT